MIQLDALSKAYGGDRLFDGVNWQLPHGQTVGVVGPNGAGKSTLFRIIAGEESADDGRVVVPQGVRIGYLPQEMTESHSGSVLDVIEEGAHQLRAMQDELTELESQMTGATGAEATRLSERYGALQDRFRQRGGYGVESRAREIASGLGFSADDFDRPVQEFSGGWRMRAVVGRLLLEQPDVLLLDEPTNHLDLESLEWLEGYIARYQGTILIISHDRYFLNRLVDGIAELAHRTLRYFPGDYDHYLVKREELRERLEKEAAEQQKEIARIEAFIERFRYKASKASLVQSRVKQLERIEPIEVPQPLKPSIHFKFPAPPRIGKQALVCEQVSKAYGDNVVFAQADFRLLRGERVALVGPNGAGKSTLLKLMAGQLAPDAGQVKPGSNVEIAYFAQHSVDQLDLSATIFAELERTASTEAYPRIRPILGAFGFSGDDVDKPISVLSGGEKSRVALAKMLLEPAGVLLLDEPTNHLDIASRQMLEEALCDFDGAVCVVSHDRYFLNAVVTRVVHIEAGELISYPGDYDYYRFKHGKLADAMETPESPEAPEAPDGERAYTKKEQRQLTAELRKERDRRTRQMRQELDRVESRIARLEAEHAEVEAELADPATYDDAERLQALNQRFSKLEASLEEAMGVWEERAAALDAIEQEYVAREADIRG